jgi:FHS family L-fucose permease-like MFS transporter
MWAILAVGLFNSVMFSNIFTLGLYRLGDLTSKGSSLLVMAIVGGGVIPLLLGAMADRIGLQHALLLPAACYVLIAMFGFAARRQNTTTVAVPVPLE